MNLKDRIIKLVKYQTQIKDKLSSPVPQKHLNRETSYRQFLTRELDIVTKKIEGLKIS